MKNISQYHALLRAHFPSFLAKSFTAMYPGAIWQPNWHHDAMAHQLTRIHNGENTRLLITVPPRYLKSFTVCVAYVAWRLGHEPQLNIVCASYGEKLAMDHAILTRTLMEQPFYLDIFPNVQPHPHKHKTEDLMTNQNGTRRATSVGGSLTGMGADLFIIDDAHKADEALSDTKREQPIEWYRSTVLTRLNHKDSSSIIIVQQRVHEADLAGHVIEMGDYYHLNLPAIADDDAEIPIGENQTHSVKAGDVLHPERESLETLNALKHSMGGERFACQYLQRPAPAGGSIIKGHWLDTFYYNEGDAKTFPRKTNDIIVQSWDTALTTGDSSDYSACVTFLYRKGKSFLLNVYRDKLGPLQLMQKIQSHYIEYRADLTIIERCNGSHHTIVELRRQGHINVSDYKPQGSKRERLWGESPYVEAGNILLRKEEPWLADFKHELLQFPNGKHDDMVDAFSQYLIWVRVMGRPYQHNTYPGTGHSRVTIVKPDMPDLNIDDLF